MVVDCKVTVSNTAAVVTMGSASGIEVASTLRQGKRGEIVIVNVNL